MAFELGLILSVAIGGWLALDYVMAESWGRRSPAIACLGAFGALWAASELLLATAGGPDALAFDRRLLYLGVYGGTFSWLWVGVEANGPAWYRRAPRRLLWMTLPLWALYSTLFWAPDGTLVSLRTVKPGHGPLFWVSAAVSWGLVCAGLWHYGRAALRFGRLRPVRTASLAAAIVVPLGLNMLYVFDALGSVDPTPALFGATALMIRFGVVDPGLTRNLPLARQDIVEQLAVGVVVADIRGDVIDANESARRLVGVDDLRGEPIEPLLEKLDDGVEVLRFPLRSHLAVTGSAVVLTDRRDAVETERRLQLSGRLQAVGSLTAGMAHEINNPLAYIRSNLNLIEKLASELVSPGISARLPDRVKLLALDGAESVVDAKDGIERIAMLVARLKDFARETSQDSGFRGLVDLGETARRAAALAGIGLPEDAIEIVVCSDPVVATDEPVVVQILVNLLLNAVQAAAGNPEVAVEIVRDGDAATIRVADRGPGLSEDVLSRVFDPFFTTKQSGTGLGLSIAYELARKLGGRLEAANRPDGGAVFSLSLPPHRRSTA